MAGTRRIRPSVEHDLLDKAGKSAAGMQVKDFDHAWRVLQPQMVSHARTARVKEGPSQDLPPLRHAKEARHLVDRMPACGGPVCALETCWTRPNHEPLDSVSMCIQLGLGP